METSMNSLMKSWREKMSEAEIQRDTVRLLAMEADIVDVADQVGVAACEVRGNAYPVLSAVHTELLEFAEDVRAAVNSVGRPQWKEPKKKTEFISDAESLAMVEKLKGKGPFSEQEIDNILKNSSELFSFCTTQILNNGLSKASVALMVSGMGAIMEVLARMRAQQQQQ